MILRATALFVENEFSLFVSIIKYAKLKMMLLIDGD